ncbi:MAG: DNA-3-methyladenine glycosylase 2 family protein [Oscillospiraceae bacterium]|nr:DNA-3-methyladenine glycosylase 2 family protein [Oscillospiraceae bacterium]
MVNYFLSPQGICIEDDNLDFDLEKTFNCGQCFRFEKISQDCFRGTVFSKNIKLYKNKKRIYIFGISEDDFKKDFINYFDFNTDYSLMRKRISKIHPILKSAAEYSKGIRILNQNPWEVLCSFIISQNNNIPRIKLIIKRLCQNFGEKISQGVYNFPDAECLSNLKKSDLEVLKCGFRYKYILDAAKKISDKEIVLNDLKEKNLHESRRILMKILGVGPKVAECTLLFGFHKLNAFPIDTWIKKTMDSFWENVDADFFGEYAGLAQQYMFYYVRMNPEVLNFN